MNPNRIEIVQSEVMPIHCAAALESSEVTKAAFGGKNSRGGPWLPQEIEISLLERADGKLQVTAVSYIASVTKEIPLSCMYCCSKQHTQIIIF